jgi:hypothetical protein
MSLPDEWRQIDKPGREDITLFVSGDGSAWEYVGQLLNGTPLLPTNCAGLTCESEIRTDKDDALLSLTAVFTTEASGIFKISTTQESVIGLLASDTAVRGAKFKLGRWQLAVIDGADRFVVLHGDVWGIR